MDILHAPARAGQPLPVPATDTRADHEHEHEHEPVYEARCLDCGNTWIVERCAYCGKPHDLWYPTGPDNDDDASRLYLCVECALTMSERLIALAGEVLDDLRAGLQVAASAEPPPTVTAPTPTPANRAARRRAMRQGRSHSNGRTPIRIRGRQHV